MPDFGLGIGILGSNERIYPPDGFGWEPPIKLYARGRKVIGDITPWQFASATFSGGKEVFVDSSKSDDTGTGLSWAQAKKTIAAAIAIATRRLIFVKPGTYIVTGGTISPDADRGPTAVIGCGSDGSPLSTPGLVRLINPDGATTWTLDSGAYKAAYTRSSVEVRDLAVPDAFGRATILTAAADAAGCQSTEGTYFLDDPGNLLWVHRAGGIAPDGDLIVTGLAQVLNPQGYTYYFQGIRTLGGTSGLNNNASADCNLYVDNCIFEQATTNGVGIQRFGTSILRKVTSRYNSNDGINYARASAVGVCQALEIDCHCHNNGVTGGKTNNASSAHNDVKVARVRGNYHNCFGPVVADVDTVKTWNVGVTAHDTECATDGSDRDFHSDGTAWLDRCISYGSPASIGGSGSLYAKKCSFGGDIDSAFSTY